MLQELIATIDENNYTQYLQQKTEHMLNNLKQLNIALPQEEIYPSKSAHYRMRSEFAVFHNDLSFDYIMFEKNSKPKKKIIIKSFKAHNQILDDLMLPLRDLICADHNLKSKLFEIDFLSNQANEVVIALNYHKKLDEIFNQSLNNLKDALRAQNFKVNLIARAKKQLVLADHDYLIETYSLKDGTKLKLKQVEGTFTQPNATTCTAMIEFARSCAQLIKPNHDLLELYCGSGTFTISLAPFFRQVLATEVARVPTQTALYNLELNQITNTKLVRLSAQEVGEALNHKREFFRLQQQKIDLNNYNFKTTFVDPPRQGLATKEALDFTAKFDNIIYISCGMDSFIADLKVLTKTHEIKKLAFFDQFPYNNHLESGTLLVRRS